MELSARAGVVEGDELIAIPDGRFADVAGKFDLVGSDEPERPEGRLSERNDGARGEDVQRLTQMVRAVAQLAHGWRRVAPVLVSRVAENGVGDEYFFARETGGLQEQREVAPRLILRKRDATAISAQATGRFGDEQYPGVQVAVGATEDAPAPFHTRAAMACLRLFHQLREAFVSIHSHSIQFLPRPSYLPLPLRQSYDTIQVHLEGKVQA